MPFMTPKYERSTMYRVPTEAGDFLVPADVFNPGDPLECTEGTELQGDPEEVSGLFCRLSAPGYMDCTEWSGPYRSLEEAQDALFEHHDVCPLCGGELEGGVCSETVCSEPTFPFSRRRLAELSYAYDLDCGGYAFENPRPGIFGDGAMVAIWDNPAPDYIPWILDDVDFYALSCPVYAFHPGTEFEWPNSWETPDGDVYALRASGELETTFHDCLCLGHDEDDPEEPHPDCERCGGDGYVTSDGGFWALYALQEAGEDS